MKILPSIKFHHFLSPAIQPILISASFFFFFSNNAHSSELSNVVHGRCAWSAGSKR